MHKRSRSARIPQRTDANNTITPTCEKTQYVDGQLAGGTRNHAADIEACQFEELTCTVARQNDNIWTIESQLNVMMACLDITEGIEPLETLKTELGQVKVCTERLESSIASLTAQSELPIAGSTQEVLVAVLTELQSQRRRERKVVVK
jgi:hypothetical protein